MDASRTARSLLDVLIEQAQAAVLYPACCADRSLLALMDSADPHLISPMGSKPGKSFRFGGSRSDLFAITSFDNLA
jgi:hypothetical protein